VFLQRERNKSLPDFRATLVLCLFTSARVLLAQSAANPAGQQTYDNNCSVCHGGDGLGGEHGPAIAWRIAKLSDEQLSELIENGRPNRGMPAFAGISGEKRKDLIAFLHTIESQKPPSYPTRKIQTTAGATLDGSLLSESTQDLALRTPDQRIHLLRSESGKFREVTSEVDWTSYNGAVNGNRYSTLGQIQKANITRLVPRWMFTISDAPYLESTPVVIEGIMYVTSANQCYALDAGNGRVLWHFQRDRTKGVGGGGGSGINRGVAWSGSHIFMVTDNAHLLSLNRFTGEVEWESVLADWRQNYDTTSAPLIAGDLVISGTAGGEGGARGFLAAFAMATGKEVWRFWTVPAPGERGSETWKGKAIAHGGAVTWFTGSFDADSNTVFWQTGNPGPDYDGKEREGDNLYSDCVIALDRDTGKLKWYYQFTPHDTHDWDAAEPLLLVDTDWHGNPRKLLLTGNRNGFFYVFDRKTGQLLLAKPFVNKLNWAKEIGADFRPVLAEPVRIGKGTKVCPSQDGATNWYSSSFSPKTGFFYLQTLEKCDIYTDDGPVAWEAGKGYLGGSQETAPGEVPQKVLRALDIQTGKVAWEYPQAGEGETWGGTLATAGGLVFFCEDSGLFMAVDAESGKPLWSFQANQNWHASPMTYEFDGRQFVTIASGQTVISFGLAE
jgi:alcohol dehydrogenase (cytochrome c)